MLSRRNVRIKVMQWLYSVNADRELDAKTVLRDYQIGVNNSFELLLFTLYVMVKITRGAMDEAERRKAKLLPGEDDKKYTPKLYDNELIKSLENSDYFTDFVEKNHFPQSVDGDLVKGIYRKYSKEESYKEYLFSPSDTKKHQKALLDMFRFVRKDEVFLELIENRYSSWEDDKSLIIGTIKKIIKALPAKKGDFLKNYYPDEDTWKDFGRQLLKLTLEEDAELDKLIKPILKNWTAERLANVDTILIKMALCEMLYFPSIPTKVTINEYLEVAKQYSTAKSKDFINGILDKLLQDLDESGKIQKEGRGLKE